MLKLLRLLFTQQHVRIALALLPSPSCQCDRNRLLLDRRGLLIAFLENAHEKLTLQEVILEPTQRSGSGINSVRIAGRWSLTKNNKTIKPQDSNIKKKLGASDCGLVALGVSHISGLRAHVGRRTSFSFLFESKR